MGAALRQVRAEGRLLRGAVLGVVTVGLVLPILAGLAQTVQAAFGVLPALGFDEPSLVAWTMLAKLPGAMTSIRLSVVTGLGSTLIALGLATALCAVVHARVSARLGAQWLAPLLAAPHAAMAIGLAFLIAPSGWIARPVAALLSWDRPPAIATVNDTAGLSLTLGLVIKELPFLALVILSATSQIDVRRSLAVARALGYSRSAGWIRVVMPLVWPLIRLPVYVVLAYALSTVDMAIILGPSNPPTLAVAVTRWYSDPDPAMFLPASAGAIAQAGIVLCAILMFRLGETVVKRLGRIWIAAGKRGRLAEPVLDLGAGSALVAIGTGAAAMIALLIWSVAWRWPFPDLLPQDWSLRAWSASGPEWGRAFANTLVIAATTSFLSMALAIAWLEGEDRARLGRARWAEALIYLPLLVPQIAFLFGLHVVFLKTGAMTGTAAVIWAQSLFVFPYVMIALSDPWRALDGRLVRTAAGLGAGPMRRLLAVKLPLLLRPLLTATAVGIAVSVAQYLPTLFLGAGRVPTLTTEAVTLSSSSDRRIMAVYGTLQALLPFAAYLFALVVPSFVYRGRQGVKGELRS